MKLGVYETEGELGRGGMGVVLAARSPDGRAVAIKVLHRTEPAKVARFEREKRLLASLGEDDGFVPLLDAGVSPQGPWLVMPLVRGGTLRDRLLRGPLAVDETIRLGRSLARALGNAHEKGIVHRDLKPENVLFTKEGRPLLADLGLAKHFDRDAEGGELSVSISHAGGFRGTFGYMAPEHSRLAKEAGPASDVFGLGAILYECLAGAPAFSGETLVDLLVRVDEGRYEPLARTRPDAPRWLAATIERTLQREPGERFADGRELERALASGERAVPAARHVGRKRGVALALAAASAVLVPLAVLVAWPESAPEGSGEGKPSPPPPQATRNAPATIHAPRPAHPDFLGPIARTPRTRLAALLGSYDWKAGAMITSIDLSEDGKLALVAGMEPYARIFELPEGRLARAFPASRITRAVALSADGKLALAAGDDCIARVYDVETGAGRELGKTGWILAVALSRDGRRAIASSYDGTVRLWDVATAKELRRIACVPNAPWYTARAAFSPDGRLALVGDWDGSVRLWNLETGEVAGPVAAHAKAVTSLRFLPRGGAVSGATDPTLHFYDLGGGGLREEGPAVALDPSPEADACTIDITPDRARAVASSGKASPRVRVWDAASGRTLHDLEGHTSWVSAARFLPGGRRIVTGSNDQTIRLWDTESGAELSRRSGHSGRIEALAVSSDGKYAATCGIDATLRVWEPVSGKELATLGCVDRPVAVALSQDGAHALTASARGIELWQLDAAGGGRRLGAIETPGTTALDFSPDGKLALSGDSEGTVSLWELAPLRRGQSWRAHGGNVVWVGFTPRGEGCLSGGQDGLFARHDCRSGETRALARVEPPVLSWSQAPAPPTGLAAAVQARVTDKGELESSTVVVFDATTGAVQATLAGGEHAIGVALVPDGSRAATCDLDGTIRLWDTRNRLLLDTIDFGKVGDSPRHLAFLRDGRSLLVGTTQGVVLRFEVE